MSNRSFMTYVAGIITALAETDGGWSPASTIYMAMGMDLNSYSHVIGVMRETDLVTVDADMVTITAKGRELAEQCNSLLKR